jgi:hypothetical protein
LFQTETTFDRKEKEIRIVPKLGDGFPIDIGIQ